MNQREDISIAQLAILGLIVGAAGILQNTNIFALSGVKINIVLVILIAFSFFVHRASQFLFLGLIGGIFLKFRPAFEFESVALIATVLLAYALKKKIPGRAFANCLMLQAAGTAVFYLILDPQFVLAANTSIFLEIVYNTAIGALVFLITSQFLSYEQKKRFAV